MRRGRGSLTRRVTVAVTPPVVAGVVVFWLAEGFTAAGVMVLVALAGAARLIARRGWVVPQAQRWVGAASWVAAVYIVGEVVAQLVIRNVDRGGSPVRPELWWTSVVVDVPVLLLVAAAGWSAMGPDPELPDALAGPGPEAARLRLDGGERALWTRSVFSRRGLACSALWGLLAVVIVSGTSGVGDPLSGSVPVLAVIVAAVQSWARVRVDDRGVRVVQPLLRRTLIGVDLGHIVEASAAEFDPGMLSRGSYGVIHTSKMAGYRATAGGAALWLETSTVASCS